MNWRDIAVTAVIIAVLAAAAQPGVYRVGPGEEHATISEVAEALEPGDIVEVTGDITDTVNLTAHGRHDAPITIRGVAIGQNEHAVRPRIIPGEGRCVINCSGDWLMLEGLWFDALGLQRDSEVAGVFHAGSHLTLRNCKFTGFTYRAILGRGLAGSITIAFCEFESSAYVDIWSWTPGAIATVEHCWFHNLMQEGMLKTHCPRNIIRYNWFENAFFSALKVVDRIGNYPSAQGAPPEGLYPMHTDIIGNVFFMGSSPGSKYSILSLGGADATEPGTEGDFHIAHNLFVQTRTDTAVPGRHILVHGNVDRVLAYNNVFR